MAASGSYLTPSAFTDTQWKIVQVADFNADAKNDVLWHHQGSGALYVWFLGGPYGVVPAHAILLDTAEALLVAGVDAGGASEGEQQHQRVGH